MRFSMRHTVLPILLAIGALTGLLLSPPPRNSETGQTWGSVVRTLQAGLRNARASLMKDKQEPSGSYVPAPDRRGGQKKTVLAAISPFRK